MDRFIGQQSALLYVPKNYLKSNMDRFIVRFLSSETKPYSAFKIQYG